MKTLILRGEEIRCEEELPVDVWLEFAEIATTPGKAMQFMALLLRNVVVEEDRERFGALRVTWWELEEAVAQQLIPEYTQRPTERPSDSSIGAGDTGASSKDGLSSPDTVRTVHLSSRAGRSRAS